MICVLYKSGYGLYYYKNPKSTVEMDFFVRDADSLVPVEVKANDKATPSLNNLISKDCCKDIRYGIKLCNKNIGFNGTFYTFQNFILGRCSVEAIVSASTSVTFRIDPEVKKDAERVFDALGMNLSVGINMFLRQVVREQKFPCALDLDIAESAKASYSPDFWSLFGSGRHLGLDVPEELDAASDAPREEL